MPWEKKFLWPITVQRREERRTAVSRCVLLKTKITILYRLTIKGLHKGNIKMYL
jgi:hypothetical protein